MKIKTKINKWNLIKLKVLQSKRTHKKMKRHSTKREKIFANKATKKGLISKIPKQLIQLSIKKKKKSYPIKKRVEDLSRHFSKDIQMVKKHMKRFSTLLIIREMQIKVTMRYHLTPVRTALFKKSTNNKVLERMWRKGNPPTLLVGM